MSQPNARWLLLVVLAGVAGCGQSSPTPPPTTSGPTPTATDVAEAVPAATPETPAAGGATQVAEAPAEPPSSPEKMTKSAPAAKEATPAAAPATPLVATTVSIDAALNARVKELAEQHIAKSNPLERRNALKQIGLALHNFHDVHGHLPALQGFGSRVTMNSQLGWRVMLLPYLEQVALFDEFHHDEPWDSEHNKLLIARMPKVFGDNPEGKTSVHVFTGEGALFPMEKGLSFRNVVDGTSNTIAVVEAGADTADIWTKPSGLPFDLENPAKALGNVGDTYLALLLDGSVVTLSRDYGDLATLIGYADSKVPQDGFRSPTAPAEPPKFSTEPLPPLAPPTETVDLGLIPADAIAAVIVQPRRMYEHPLVQDVLTRLTDGDTPAAERLHESLPRDAVLPLEDLGVQLHQIEEIRFIVGKDALAMLPPTDGAPPLAARVTSAVPFDVERTITRLSRSAPGMEVRDVAGVMCLCRSQVGMAVGFINDRQLIGGNEAVVEAMLKAQAADTPLTQKLRAAGNRLFVAALASEELGAALQPLIQQMPPQMMVFSPYVTKCQGLSLAFDLDAPNLLHLSIEFEQPELATGMHAMLDVQLQSGKEMFAQQKPVLEQGEMAAVVPYLTQLMDGLQLKADADTLTFTAARPDKLQDLPALLEPAFQQARKAAQRTQQSNDLKMIGLAMHNFHDVYRHFPAMDGVGDPKAKTGLSWRVHLLPFLEEAPLYEEFHLDEPWDSEHNLALVKRMPKLFGDDPDGKTRLHVLTGNGAPFQNGKGVRIQEIRDGTSNTIMVVEAGPETADIWTKPGGLEFDDTDPLKCLGELPDEGFQALFMDGSVRYISTLIDPQMLGRLIQHQDGQVIGDF